MPFDERVRRVTAVLGPTNTGKTHYAIERMLATGLVSSEVPCGSAPTKWRFLQRNRLIAALGDATVVVEAGWRSGVARDG